MANPERPLRSKITSLFILLILGGDVLATTTWTITSPAANALYKTNATIAGSGGSNSVSTSYTIEVKTTANVVMTTATGTTTATAPATWSSSVAPPTGGWTAGAAIFRIYGSDDGSAYQLITFN